MRPRAKEPPGDLFTKCPSLPRIGWRRLVAVFGSTQHFRSFQSVTLRGRGPHQIPDKVKDMVEATLNPRHNRPGGGQHEACHQSILNQVLTTRPQAAPGLYENVGVPTDIIPGFTP